MKISIIVILITVTAAVVLWKKTGRGVYRPLSFVPLGISELLDRGFDGGFMIFKHENSEKFIQLSKWIKGNDCGLELSFPIVAWSSGYADELKEFCKEEELKFKVTKGSDGMEFIDINFSSNVTAAANCAEHILLSIFNIPESDSYYVQLEGASA